MGRESGLPGVKSTLVGAISISSMGSSGLAVAMTTTATRRKKATLEVNILIGCVDVVRVG